MPTDPHAFFEERIAYGRATPSDYRELVRLLWESYGQNVFLFAQAKLGNVEDARDVCQDVFLKAVQWLQSNQGRTPTKVNFPAWLRRIARNLIIDRFRRPAMAMEFNASALGSEDEDMPRDGWAGESATSDPAAEVSRDEEIAALNECIQSMPEKRRRILTLRDIDGLSYAEVAEAEGIPPGTVATVLHRARSALRECVEIRLAR